MCPLYDVDRRGWIELQPMSIARLGHGVVAAGQFGLKRSFKKKKKMSWFGEINISCLEEHFCPSVIFDDNLLPVHQRVFCL